MAGKKVAIAVSVVVVVVLVAAVFLFSGAMRRSGSSRTGTSSGTTSANSAAGTAAGSTNTGSGTTATQGSGQQAASAQKVKFADTPYYNYAYDISDNATSAREQAALSGYAVQKTQLANGSMKIVLKALEPQYHDQSYTVLPGETLYFIEGSFGDDAATREYNLGDDAAVLVDKNGYLIQ